MSPDRNTPTGVGKTDDGVVELHEQEKHPHGCGEDVILQTL